MSETSNGLIVVGVDGSAHSDAAVQWADHHAVSTGATLRLVTAWALARSYGLAIKADGYDPHADALIVAEKARAGLSTPPERVQSWIREGAAGPALREASQGALALVVGSTGHSAISRLVIGSVSSYCLHEATCPVVVIPGSN